MFNENKERGFSTLSVHAGVEPDPSTGAIMTPVYLTSTYVQEGIAEEIIRRVTERAETIRLGDPADVATEMGPAASDAQRDRIYTRMLSESIVSAYRRDNLVQATHIVAFVAWSLLRAAHPGRDLWQHVFSTETDRTLHRRAVLEGLDRVLAALDTLAGSSKLRMALPAAGARDRAEAVLDEALARFASFHRTCALAHHRGSQLLVGPRLALYYSNRLTGYGLDTAARGEQS